MYDTSVIPTLQTPIDTYWQVLRKSLLVFFISCKSQIDYRKNKKGKRRRWHDELQRDFVLEFFAIELGMTLTFQTLTFEGQGQLYQSKVNNMTSYLMATVCLLCPSSFPRYSQSKSARTWHRSWKWVNVKCKCSKRKPTCDFLFNSNSNRLGSHNLLPFCEIFAVNVCMIVILTFKKRPISNVSMSMESA